MKWCRFQSGKTVAYGTIDGTTLTEVTGSPFESYSKTANTSMLSRVKLLVPVIPPTFYAAGVNYREHVTEMAHRRGVKPEFPPQADVGYRANNALVATDEPIVIPKDATNEVQYEGELVVVIGRRADLPDEVLQEIDENIRVSTGNTGTTLCLAINYGGRTELVDAVRELNVRVPPGECIYAIKPVLVAFYSGRGSRPPPRDTIGDAEFQRSIQSSDCRYFLLLGVTGLAFPEPFYPASRLDRSRLDVVARWNSKVDGTAMAVLVHLRS